VFVSGKHLLPSLIFAGKTVETYPTGSQTVFHHDWAGLKSLPEINAPAYLVNKLSSFFGQILNDEEKKVFIASDTDKNQTSKHFYNFSIALTSSSAVTYFKNIFTIVIFALLTTYGLCCKSCMIAIYDHCDSIIVICDRNDSGHRHIDPIS
jgi:hypothetical protein